jgi:hypothetical protein
MLGLLVGKDSRLAEGKNRDTFNRASTNVNIKEDEVFPYDAENEILSWSKMKYEMDIVHPRQRKD